METKVMFKLSFHSANQKYVFLSILSPKIKDIQHHTSSQAGSCGRSSYISTGEYRQDFPDMPGEFSMDAPQPSVLSCVEEKNRTQIGITVCWLVCNTALFQCCFCYVRQLIQKTCRLKASRWVSLPCFKKMTYLMHSLRSSILPSCWRKPFSYLKF